MYTIHDESENTSPLSAPRMRQYNSQNSFFRAYGLLSTVVLLCCTLIACGESPTSDITVSSETTAEAYCSPDDFWGLYLGKMNAIKGDCPTIFPFTIVVEDQQMDWGAPCVVDTYQESENGCIMDTVISCNDGVTNAVVHTTISPTGAYATELEGTAYVEIIDLDSNEQRCTGEYELSLKRHHGDN